MFMILSLQLYLVHLPLLQNLFLKASKVHPPPLRVQTIQFPLIMWHHKAKKFIYIL